MTPIQVTFVVPTKNAMRTLAACLASLSGQRNIGTEIIVVDNASSDDTTSIARRFADVVCACGPERSAQRNHGAQLARGEIVVFVDADMVVEPTVARECVDRFRADPSVGALVLPELSFGVGYFAQCRALEKELYVGDAKVEAARAFRIEAFHAAGRFDVKLNAFEDWDLADRVQASGWRIDRVEARVWHDDGRVSPLRQFRKKRYYGKQSGRYLARHASTRRRPVIRTSLFRDPMRLLARAWLVPGLVLLKLAEAAGIAAGVLGAHRAQPASTAPPHAFTATGRPRILHVVGEFDANEGMGRSIIKLTDQVSAEHHVVAARIGAGGEHFASTHEIGGSMSTFPLLRARRVRSVMRRVAPDVVHLHGGPLVSLWAPLPVFRAPRLLASIYVWPRVPAPRALGRGRIRAATRSQVLRPRIVAAHLLAGRVAAFLLRQGGVRDVLTPDPAVAGRLSRYGLDVHVVPVGVGPDSRRARCPGAHPVVVFAGRAETVRGIDTLLDAIPALRERHPGLRVRLLLLVRPEVEAIARRVRALEVDDVVEVVTEPLADLRSEFANASVAVFPFKFDHVTIPPALTVAEAMSVGLPVIGTDVACINAIVRHDQNGVLVPIDDADALAVAIGDLFDDPVRWKRLARNAARTIEVEQSRADSARVLDIAYGTLSVEREDVEREVEARCVS